MTRMRVAVLIGVGAIVAAAAVEASHWNGAKPSSHAADPKPPVGTIYPVAPNLYVVPGGGGNSAVFVTARGVVLVDTKYRVNWDGLLAQIRTVTDKPVTHVINSACARRPCRRQRAAPGGRRSDRTRQYRRPHRSIPQ